MSGRGLRGGKSEGITKTPLAGLRETGGEKKEVGAGQKLGRRMG